MLKDEALEMLSIERANLDCKLQDMTAAAQVVVDNFKAGTLTPVMIHDLEICYDNAHCPHCAAHDCLGCDGY